MPFDRDEYAAFRASRFPDKNNVSAERARERHITAEMLQRASVSSEYLTGDPYWDEYLTIIKALIDRENQEREQWMEKLLSPSVCAADDVAQCKLNVLISDSRIAAWYTVMEIPAQIRADGERAKEWLATHKLDLGGESD